MSNTSYKLSIYYFYLNITKIIKIGFYCSKRDDQPQSCVAPNGIARVYDPDLRGQRKSRDICYKAVL